MGAEGAGLPCGHPAQGAVGGAGARGLHGGREEVAFGGVDGPRRPGW